MKNLKLTWHTEKRKLSQLKGYEFNPRTLTQEQYADLKKSLEKFDLAEIPAINTNNIIVAGHQRVKILSELYGPDHIIEVRVPTRKLTEKEYQEYNIRSNKNTGSWDFDLLANRFEEADLIDWGFEESDLLGKTTSPDPEIEIPVVKKIMTSEDLEAILKAKDKFYFAFSGGKDSCLSLVKMLPVLRENKKEFEVLYVDTGTEFPDVMPFVYRYCKALDAPLKVLKSEKNFFDVFGIKKCFPDPKFKDCISELINKTLDKYTFRDKENFALIRGGRPDQKNKGSNSNLIQVIKKGTKELTIINPLFNLSKTEYEAELNKIPKWGGYEKGFNRTACWCCPFQKDEQWIALKTYYPFLWEEMKILAETWKWEVYKGDSNLKRFYKYWKPKKC